MTASVSMPRPTIYYNDNDPQVCAWIRQRFRVSFLSARAKHQRIPPCDEAAGYGNAIVPQAAALFIRAFDAVTLDTSGNNGQ